MSYWGSDYWGTEHWDADYWGGEVAPKAIKDTGRRRALSRRLEEDEDLALVLALLALRRFPTKRT